MAKDAPPASMTNNIPSAPTATDATLIAPPPKPVTPKYVNIPVETRSDAATLVYMAVINTIFNNMLLNREERINSENIEPYTRFLKKTMTYFGKWKEHQLRLKYHKVPNSDETFLDRITWRNLRGGLCPFVYFAGYIIRELPSKIDGFNYVPMLFCNQSPLEGQFSAVRASNHDTSDKYAGVITSKSVRQSNASQSRSKTYSTEDCAMEKNTYITGTSVFTKHSKLSADKLQAWMNKREAIKKKRTQTEAFVRVELFQSTKMEKLAEMMNTHIIQSKFIDALVNNQFF